MNREKFIQKIEETFEDGLALVRAKNEDYANDTNPWRNFEYAELAKVPVEKAILVRVTDKLARIANLIEKEDPAVDESIEDTLIDLINYTAILKVYLEWRGEMK